MKSETKPTMIELNERQLEIMRRDYPGFKDKDIVVRRVKADEQRYRKETGWIPFKDEAGHDAH